MTLSRAGVPLLALCLFLVAPPGCGGGKTQVTADNTTTGQELQDLADARDKGIITEAEYNKQRKRVLSGK